VVRALFYFFGAVLTLAVVAWGTVSVVDLIGHTTDVQPIAYGAQVRNIVIRTGSGSVTVRGSSRADISGQRTVEHSWQTPTVDEHVDGDTLTLTGHCQFGAVAWCSVSYTLDVPSGVHVDVDSGSGTVSMANLDGDVVAHTGAGTIDATELSGPLDLETGAGSVSATQLTSATLLAQSGAGSLHVQFVRPPTKVEAHSGAGSIDVEVPRDGTAYAVTGTTGHGSREIKVATAPGSNHVLQLESGAGSTSVHYPGT
jgi:DUF4097 and DUF4098 domain-containing protein YvlB